MPSLLVLDFSRIGVNWETGVGNKSAYEELPSIFAKKNVALQLTLHASFPGDCVR
jgi:hypothetical protein